MSLAPRCSVLVAGLLLAGCSLVPAAPPTQSTGLPTTSTSTSANPVANPPLPAPVTAAGFSAFEQAALRVRNIGCGGIAVGSGFAISDHTFVTNRHVVGGAALLQVSTFDGRDIDVTSVGSALIADLALVRTRETLPATISLATANPALGAPVTAIGFPEGGPLTTTHGQVLGYAPDPVGWSSLPMLMNDAPIQHGSSGSALLDASGHLVGVVYATSGHQAEYAVPVQVLKTLMANPDNFAAATDCDGAPPTPSPTAAATRCSDTVSVGPATSCSFGLNVAAAWRAAGGGTVTVTARSPVTGQTYAMACTAGSLAVCVGGNGAVVYVRDG